MCGIFGSLHKDPQCRAEAAPLAAMGQKLAHRGPDADGLYAEGPIALGHRRLSIIDLSDQGRQPMTNEDGTLWIVFNGEIFNYRDHLAFLKGRGHHFKSKTDTEVILHLYEEFGIDCLARLNGMFAFALWDKNRGELFLVRDRMGIKPLHYADTGTQVVFASEIKSLLAHPAVSRRVSAPALGRYLALEYVPAPYSIFSAVRKVQPGHYVHIRPGKLDEVRYWSTAGIVPGPAKKVAEYAEELETLLDRAVRRALVSDVPLGAFLSGGIDSGTVAAFMQAAAPGHVETFSIGFEEASFDESRYSRQIADHLGTRHHHDVLSAAKMLALIPRAADYLDEPFADASFFPTLLLSEFTRRHVKVALSGDGGDELFAGYPTYFAHAWAQRFARLPAGMQKSLRALAGSLPVSHRNISLDFKIKKFLAAASEPDPVRRHYRWLGAFEPAEFAELLAPDLRTAAQAANVYEPLERYASGKADAGLLEQLLYCDQRFYLQDDMLVKVDRASMAASLEVRVPFLDHEVVEFAARLPARYKLRGMVTKYLLKRVMRAKLPPNILRRPKKGFGVPLARWFCGPLKPLLEDVFSGESLRQTGLFNAQAVQRLLHEHWQRRADHRKKIYTLLNFELWRRAYRPEF